MDEIQRMREGVARELGVALYKAYSEPEAAHFLGIDLTTLKRMRRAEKVPYVSLGERKVRYLGIHICDLYAYGEKWENIKNATFKLENTGLASGTEAQHGIEPATTPKIDAQTVLALARKITKPPSKP